MSNLLKPLINRDLERIQKYQKKYFVAKKKRDKFTYPAFCKVTITQYNKFVEPYCYV